MTGLATAGAFPPLPADSDEFESYVSEFFERTCRPLTTRAAGWGSGSDALAGSAEPTRAEEAVLVAEATAFRRALFDAGLGWITGPPAYGGSGLTSAHREAFDRIAAGYERPSEFCFVVGLHIVAPTILQFGTDEARSRYLRELHRADLFACQLFSEPDAGSDLAGVRTRARRDGDGWRLTGQKVWTSGAHYSQIGEVLVRTDPSAPKHRGLTMMLVQMDAPGMQVRPLRQITGGEAFNEVFLDDVFVPDSHVLGAPGEGWRVAMATLGDERSSMGSREIAPETDPVLRLRDLIRHVGREADPGVRQRYADVVIRRRVGRWTAARAAARRVSAGPGAETAIVKLIDSENLRQIGQLAGDLLGPAMTADTGEWGTYVWSQLLVASPARRIAGGTDEVMRNIMGEQVLGLPKEPRPDAPPSPHAGAV